MILGRPAIDWLTLTTYDEKAHRKAARLARLDGETVEASVRQYGGRRGEGWFSGVGPQNGNQHYMIRLSGDKADYFTWQQNRPPMDCTRIDVQLTVPLPTRMGRDTFDSFVELAEIAEIHEEKRGQRGRKVGGPLYPDGFCTLYIGSRQSTRFYRLYVKEHSGGFYLRFEVEYKDKSGLAGRIWRDTLREPERAVSWLQGEINTLPDHKLTTPIKSYLMGVPGELMKQGRQVNDPNKTLAWLRKQVSPAMRRLLGNEDTRDAAQIILMDWLKFAANTGELINE